MRFLDFGSMCINPLGGHLDELNVLIPHCNFFMHQLANKLHNRDYSNSDYVCLELGTV